MAKELEFCQSDFKCAVFNGSTLVTLYKDIRKEVAKGGIIIIDGNRCRISKEGEWCSNRIELEHDYPGNTNLDAIITFEGAKPPPRKIVKANPTPVPTSEIAAALAGLDDVYSYVNQLENNHKPIRDSTPKKPKQKQLSIKSPVLLNGTDYSTNLRLDVGERVMDDPGQFSGAPTLLSNPKERSMSSIRSLSALAAAVSTVPSQPLQSTPERHMLHELSQISENDRIERKQDMNKRLVEKVDISV